MEGNNICGQAVTTECPEIEIKPLPALDFQLWFIDSLADILSKSRQPKIKVLLFDADETATNQVVINPSSISNVHIETSSKTFGVRLELYNNEEKTAKAYSILLAMVKVIINVTDVLVYRKGFRYECRMTITNSGQAVLLFEIAKNV